MDQQPGLEHLRLSSLFGMQVGAPQVRGRAGCTRVIPETLGFEEGVAMLPSLEIGRPTHHMSSPGQNKREHVGHLPS